MFGFVLADMHRFNVLQGVKHQATAMRLMDRSLTLDTKYRPGLIVLVTPLQFPNSVSICVLVPFKHCLSFQISIITCLIDLYDSWLICPFGRSHYTVQQFSQYKEKNHHVVPAAGRFITE